MKILVTGANGYLGQGIVKQLLDDGLEVIATDLKTDYVDLRAKTVDADLFSIEDPYVFFGSPDAILHLAWRNGFSHNDISHIIDLPKHFLFIEKMVNSGLKKVSIMGTMHEIGFYEGVIDENTSCNPINFYGISKNALRCFIETMVKNRDIVFQWLRGFYIVGNSTFGNSIFSKITKASSDGIKEFPFNSGKNKYDFLDYEDFCLRTASAVEQNQITGIINICSGIPLELSTRVEQFITDNNLKITLQYGKFPDRPYDSKAIWGDSKKINQIMSKRRKKL